MPIEKIILGDDNLDFARKSMPYVPNSTVEYVDTPQDLIAKVKAEEDLGNPYTIVISDYDYGNVCKNGLDVFDVLQTEGYAKDARKILWTGNADDKEIRADAGSLGLEVLDKNQLGALVGMSVTKAPLKKDGLVMVYFPEKHDNPMYKALDKVVSTLLPGIAEVRSDLREALKENRYGLVLDTTTMKSPEGHGAVAHDMKYLELDEVPLVECMKSLHTLVPDIMAAACRYHSAQKR